MTFAGTVPPSNLPLALTSFVGRGHELEGIARALSSARLVTLTGPGGVGKTRLATEVASVVGERFPDGRWVVDLAPVTSDELVAETVRSALGMRDPVRPGGSVVATGSAASAIAEHLGARSVLVIVDNCEHVIAGCAALALELLRVCPGLTILATSREPLGIVGEAVWRVPSMPLDDSARLFAERAALADPSVELDDAGTIARICGHLDGIPLAIELAAARAGTMAIGEIASHLDDRLTLLAGSSRSAPPRQQSLRAALDWSYDLLDVAEQTLFRRLAVFGGGFTLESVTHVCCRRDLAPGDALDLLGRLVDKSLVVAAAHRGTTRYRLLETVRQYALEKISEPFVSATVNAEASAGAAEWCFRREGEYWAIGSPARPTRHRDSKGLTYLARLVTQPGREFHVLELVGTGGDPGDAGETLDERARDEYRRRIMALDEEIAEADSWNDGERRARAEAERDAILDQLSRDLALGGRARRSSSTAERARTAVTQAIRNALRRLAEHEPEVGRYLDRTVRTGTFCAYVPDPEHRPRFESEAPRPI